MISIRPSQERGTTRTHWLASQHSFSFGEYFDPAHTGFRSLRVINQDVVAPGTGFGLHGHRNMEIVTFVRRGELAHGDSLGHGSTLGPGDLQRMSAGRGIRHQEFNPSSHEPVEFLQIWIEPSERDLPPSYEESRAASERGNLSLLVSRDGGSGTMQIGQDVAIYRGQLEPGASVNIAIDRGRGAWLQLMSGKVRLNEQALGEGDGAAVEEESTLNIIAEEAADFLLFDLS